MDTLLYRKCPNCNEDKPLTKEYFHGTQIKGKPDFHRYCKPCRKITRKDSYKYRTLEQQKSDCQRSAEYQRKTISGRAIVMLKSYRTSDRNKNREFDLTKDWLINNIIDKPCFYCNDNYRTGCDRLDNKIGHTMENCIPCCSVCNTVRSDIFTVLEMKELGDKIKELRLKREIRKISGNSKERLEGQKEINITIE